MRILHFSDVHLDVRNIDAVRQTMNRMISCVKKYHGELVTFDLIVFSGDMIDRGGLDESQNVVIAVQEGLNAFRDMVIQPICTAFNLESDHFIVTMGNHDADWKPVGDDVKNKIRDLYKKDGAIYDFYRDNIINNHASWIKAFNQFRDSLYTTVDYNSNPAFANVVYTIAGKKVGVSILNSAWGSLPGENMVYLERAQIADSKNYLQKMGCEYKICVMHNPYYSLCEQELVAVRKMIMENYDVCFTGHTHQPDGLGLMNENHICYLSTAHKISSANRDVKEHDRRYVNGFVVFEDDGENYHVAKYVYNESYEFELLGGVENTRKSPPHYVNNISALFDLNDELRTAEFIFLRSEQLDAIIEDLRGDKYQFIRLSALSGFGKTRLVYETFIEHKSNLIKPEAYTYYCESYPDNKLVFNEIKAIVKCNASKQGLIILDNCKRSLMSDVVEFMRREDTRMRLIAIDNNPYDSADVSPYFHQIIVEPDVIRDSVNTYIDEQLSLPDYFERKEDVKKLADGSPYMAYRLIEKLRENGSVGIGSIRDLIMDMLDVEDREEADEYQRALQAMALFQPMPTEEGNKEAYDFIVGNNLITHLKSNDIKYRQDLFQRVMRRYDKTLIDKERDWMVVRPYPLAIWLIQDWFEVVHREEEFIELIDAINQQPDYIKNTLSNSLFKRIDTMQESLPAKQLAGKLFDVNGPFCSEKVVCSEMGSRLFLAMATVNPEKVAEGLRNFFDGKSTEWIRDNIKDDIRRNFVYTLNKLCFASESYGDAVIVMAQFAKAENEHWSNNSKNGLTQLFPCILPNTEVSLERRVKTIEDLWDKGYHEFAIAAVNTAFKAKYFTRECGPEKFGWHHRESYHPQDNEEVFRYWNSCKELLLHWLEIDNSIQVEVRNLVEGHVYEWHSSYSMDQYLFPLIDAVAPMTNWQWNKMYELLIQLIRFKESKYTPEQEAKIKEYIEKLKPTSFADTLVYAGREIFTERTDKKSYEELAHDLMLPLAKRFVKDNIFDNIDEVRALIAMQSGEGFFVEELKSLLDDRELATLLYNVKQIVIPQIDDFSSNFVNGILRAFSHSIVVEKYVTDLLNEGYKSAYSRALAAMENDNMDSYRKLLSLYKEKQIGYEHIALYLASLYGLSNAGMRILLPSLIEQFPEKKTDVLQFVMRHRYWTTILDDELHEYVRTLLLECPLVDDQLSCNYEQIDVIKEYLKKYKYTDVEFGVKINEKVIDTLGKNFIHNNKLGELYSELLQEPYQSAILDYFIEALADDNKLRFHFQVQNEVGSGFSFGEGPLFQYVSPEKLKKYCEKNVRIRSILANMAPVFTCQEDNRRVGFSSFIQWLIDKYGDDEESGVLSGISANMGTMSWTGSTIPLHEDMIRILTPYLTHRFAEVQKWAQQEIDQYKKQISMEKSRDDFMRMHYS